jgi:hypothetical protein
VLDRQTQCRHVGTIDNYTVIRRVLCPSSDSVVGSPSPDIVKNDVVAIHFEAGVRAPGGRSAYSEEDVIQRCRIGGATTRRFAVASVGLAAIVRCPLRAYLEKHARGDGAGIDDETSDDDAIGVRNGEGWLSCLWDERREPKAEYDGMRAGNGERPIKMIKAGSQKN